MKKIITKGIIMLVLVMAAVLAMPEGMIQETGTGTVEAAAKKASLNKKQVTVIKGKKYTLKVKNTKKKASWSSSNKKVASVNKKGVVTAKNTGSAVITAKVSGKKLKCRVTVVALNKSKAALVKGKTCQLKVNGTREKVSWSSSNKKVASVNKKGVVTAKSVGGAAITAKVSGKTLKCSITVKEDSSRYKLSAGSLTLYPGESKGLSVKNTGMGVSWSSSNKSVATVDKTGMVKAVQEGSAAITAKVNGKKLSAEVKVVKPKLNSTQVRLEDNSPTVVLKVENAKTKVTWNTEELSENFYYEISGKQGENLTLTKKEGAFGEDHVTAKTGTYSMGCDVKSYTVQELELTCLEPTESDFLIYEEGITGPSSFPGYGTLDNSKTAYRHYENIRKMTFVSTDETIVKVVEGVEYVYKRGKATLTGATEDGYASYIFHVTVEGSYLKTYGEYDEQASQELFERLKQEITRSTVENGGRDPMPEEEWEHLLGIAEKWYKGEITYREMVYQMRWTKPEGVDVYQNYVINPETGEVDEAVSGYYIFNAWKIYSTDGILNAQQIEDYLNTQGNYTADPDGWRIALNLLFIRVHYDRENNRTIVYMVL